MKFAYADPPYLGQARKHYGPDAKEVNHSLLIEHLNEWDSWALSLSSPSLRVILPMCPADVRVCAWVKPFASFKPNVNPAYCWEPVIVRGGRSLGREVPTVRDFSIERDDPNLSLFDTPDCVVENITLQRGVSGAKPERFCFWLFDFVGLTPDDTFDDLFLGSGAVTRAWEKWRNQRTLTEISA